MPIVLNPPIALRSIADARPGSVVRLGDQFGFCAESEPAVANGAHVPVVYDAPNGAFQHLAATSISVLDFGSDLIITPDLASIAPSVDSNSNGSELLLVGSSLKIAIRIDEPGGTGRRIFDLTTGTITQAQSAGVAFTKWSVSVRSTTGTLIELMKVEPRYGSALDEGPMEPDET